MNVQQIIDSEKEKPKSKKKKRGKPADPNIAQRNKKLLEAWEAGHYSTYAEIAREFDMPSADAARKAIAQEKRRQNKK